MQDEASLLTLQRRFLSALREPIFGESRSRSELPARPGQPSATFLGAATSLLTASPSLRPTERLELYHRQYWYRLLDSLADDFPGLRSLVGEQSFWGVVEAYLEATPARTFTLRHLGAGLADFIGAHSGLVSLPMHAEDMARLEYALCSAYTAADRAPVDAQTLATQPVALQPHVHLLRLRTPADTLWRYRARRRRAAVATAGASRVRGRRDRLLVVFRRAFVLEVERLPRLAFAILTGIARTGSLDRALDSARLGKLRRHDVDRVRHWFTTWVARGWFCRSSSAVAIDERNTP